MKFKSALEWVGYIYYLLCVFLITALIVLLAIFGGHVEVKINIKESIELFTKKNGEN